ncbi:MAG: hypothetical protein P8Z79_18545 [Sedimentisphaerales bacterium]|jgi:hypothetical protein
MKNLKRIALKYLAGLFLICGCAGLGIAETYDLTIPDAWKRSLSVGALTVDCNAFYGVPWSFGLYPSVRLQLPVENLTSDTLHFKVNYRTESKEKGYGNSGMGVEYTLAPGEKRLIDTIAPIASVTRDIRFLLRMSEPFTNPISPVSTSTVVVTIDPFKVSAAGIEDMRLTNVENQFFEVKGVQLAYSEEEGNRVIIEMQNKTSADARLEAFVAVNDPENIESKGVLARPRGFFSDTIETIPACNTTSITIPYHVPPIGPSPVLVYTLFKPNHDIESGTRDHRRWDMTLVAYGSLDLVQAAAWGRCVIPVYPPVEERARLTAQRQSEHLLFRYRPGSYAEKNVEKIIGEREGAYARLSKVLKMELPEIVTIDLYPDMEAKGLGSGTTWTPANTRTNKHICEVYDEQYQCDPFHELAHIFSYHFPGYGSNQGGIVEAFAAYFEPNNMRIGPTRQILRRQLSQGELSSLDKILLSSSSSQELVILIDFLLNKDVEKFKAFYVRVTRTRSKAGMEKACRQIYGTDLKGLERQWHEYLNQG